MTDNRTPTPATNESSSSTAAPAAAAAVDQPDPKPAVERTPKFSDYLRVFTYATKWDFCIYAIASLASIGAGVTLPLMTVIFGQLVGEFTDYFRTTTTTTSSTTTAAFERLLDRQALYILYLFLARWALSALTKHCFRTLSARLSSAVRQAYLRALFAQPIAAIDTLPQRGISPAAAITATANALQLGTSERLGTLLQALATVVAALAVAFAWSWDVTLVTSALVVWEVGVLAAVVPAIVRGQAETAKAEARGAAVAGEALEGVRLVVACGAQGRVAEGYAGWVRRARDRAWRMAPVVGVQFGLVFFGVFGAFGLAFWYGTRRYAAGAIGSAGVVVVVLMSVMMVLTSLERISTPLMAVSKATVAACELFTVIDAPLPAPGLCLKPEEDGDLLSSADLVFEDVSFEYPGRPGVKVLDGLGLRIRPGMNTALVGPSGAGKSTVVGLLERWYSLREQPALPQVVIGANPPENTSIDEERKINQPDKEAAAKMPATSILSGRITVGGLDLEDLDLKWWRAQVGLVQQEPFLFNDTIFNNVANGLVGTEWSGESETRKRELVRDACQEAYAHEFISRLPDGYDTRVGDGGAKLSGGQKQRLAIARSIVKKPRVIILDEATSAIDVKSERLVQAALDKVTRGRTTITIAHRLSTIKKADHIVVLQKGRAVEEGTHQSLIADPSGVYSALVRAQSLHLSSTDGAEVDTEPIGVGTEPEKVLSDDDDDSPATNPAHTSTHQENAASKPRNAIRSFSQLLSQQRLAWPYYAGIVLSAMAVGAGTPLQAWLFAKVLGVFLLSGADLKASGEFWGLMWLALAAGVGAAYFVEGWLGLHVQYAIGASCKLQYLTDTLHQRIAFFDADGNAHGALTARIAADAKHVEELFGLNLACLLSGVFTAAGCVAVALAFSWRLGLLALCVTMPVLLAAGFWKYRHEVRFDAANEAVFAESAAFAAEAVGAIRTVSALAMEDAINDRYRRLLEGHVQAAARSAARTAALYGFADSASLACQALVFWYGGRLLARGEFGMEAFFVCFMAVIQGAEAASQVLSVAPNVAQAAAAAGRMLDVQASAHGVEGEAGAGGARGGGEIPGAEDDGVRIELRDVHFKYPTRDVPIFQGLDLTIEKGQFAAFVGPSGCGKSTIISLLERFYDLSPSPSNNTTCTTTNNRGTILVNGIDIASLDPHAYRRNLSLVAQEPRLFRGTVRDNILFGIDDNGASVTDDAIHAVCRDAFIHDFITSLPEGYATPIDGVALSGGQKQRLALARALIRDPEILLLDEATSALDSESERLVLAALEGARARKGEKGGRRTVVAVAHRLATVQGADVIFVFDARGRVVERGTHAELVGRRGVYWDMCRSQALDQ